MKKIIWLNIVMIVALLCSCADLLYNSRTGDIEGIEKALESGASLEAKNERGSTALIVAAYSGKADAVEYLCARGANVNAQDNNGATALIHAAYYDLYDVAEVLVTKCKADKTIKDKYENTPLDYAKQYGFTRMISLLQKD